MKQKYEYDFVRIGEGLLWVKDEAKDSYKDIINKYAEEGWRLVQVFAPSTGFSGVAKYIELIFEREVENN